MEEMTKEEKKHLRQEEWKEKLDKEKHNKLFQAIFYWGLGALLIILALWTLIAFSSGTTTSTPQLKAPAVTASDFQTHPTGSASSGQVVTLIEYADFQCPACKAYHPVLTQLEGNFGDKLNVVYRMFPLKQIHKNALNGGKAAYAASLQNGFWIMHDKLFDGQNDWANLSDPESVFVQYAKDLGLTVDQFKKDYESQKATDFVNTSLDNANTIGLTGTPTFFLNGKQIDNPQGYEPFKKLVQDAINK